MKFSVKFSPEALRDLDEIYDYISNTLNSPVAADHTVNKILGKTDFLAENPEIGRCAAEADKRHSRPVENRERQGNA